MKKKRSVPLRVIVIGSGIAGLHFSLKAARQGHHVTLITKKKMVDAATNFAQGGIAAVLNQTDDFKKHFGDTLRAGAYHNRKKAVQFMIQQGPKLIHELIETGVPFATHHGKLLLAREGGHSERRVAFVGDYTGQEIERALVSAIQKEKNIFILEHTFAIDLLVLGNICYGVQVLSKGKIKNILADVTVLASGGLGRLFERTTNPEISTGDGYAMGFRAGASLRDMEFIQFHPTAFRMKNGQLHLLTEAIRGEGAFLRNSKGIRFMKSIHPLAELAPRDIVARTIFKEQKTGTVYLDLRHLPEETIHTRFPKLTEMLKQEGFDITQDLVPITPAAHYCCGGIEVDLEGKVASCRGLYAFGEVAWTGVHGANRLASNSLLEALVFSNQIMKKARPLQLSKILQRKIFRKFQKKNTLLSKMDRQKISAIHASARREREQAHPRSGYPVGPAQRAYQIKKELQKTMWEYAGIVREKTSLLKAHAILRKLLSELSLVLNEGFHPAAWEVRNMLETGLLIIKAALKRKQSLGCHFRKN